MTLVDLVNKPCTLVLRRTGASTDELGDAIEDVQYADTVCELQQEQRQEPLRAGEASITTWLVTLLPGYVVRTGDAMEVDGYGSFEFVGDSWDAKTGSADMWHVEATAKQTALPEEVGS